MNQERPAMHALDFPLVSQRLQVAPRGCRADRKSLTQLVDRDPLMAAKQE
jgi:hypothetical protein